MTTTSSLYAGKPWLALYHSSVPAEIDVHKYASLVALFENCCKRFGANAALENMGTTLTYAQFDAYSKHLAAYLLQSLKLKKGARVAVILPNCLQYPIVIMAILRAGLTVVNLNPLYTAPEMAHSLKDSDADAVIVFEAAMGELCSALKSVDVKHVIVTGLGDLLGGLKGGLVNFAVRYIKRMVPKYDLITAIAFKKALKLGAQLKFSEPQVKRDDIAFLQYTGGTTGTPKSAMLSHGNMVANVLQCVTWIKPVLNAAGSDVVLTALPLYHIFSLTVCCFCFMEIGGKSLLITDPRDLNGFIKTLAKARVSIFIGLNTLFIGLLRKDKFKQLDFSQYTLTVAGGMAVQKAVADEWQKVTGMVITEGYGLTEASPVVSINPVDRKQFNGSIGLPVPSTEISIRDDNGDEVEIGGNGTLWVKGPQVMRGYWRQPQQTATVLKAGWLNTGDEVRMDDEGFIYVVGRKKDMILVSGFNVYPNEIEDVIAMIPQVKEVAVIGVPSSHSGEAIKAYIVATDATLQAEKIIAFCRQRLTGYKIPKYIEFRDSLPKSNVGKVLRRVLREETGLAD